VLAAHLFQENFGVWSWIATWHMAVLLYTFIYDSQTNTNFRSHNKYHSENYAVKKFDRKSMPQEDRTSFELSLCRHMLAREVFPCFCE
jgi:hypothetical protein